MPSPEGGRRTRGAGGDPDPLRIRIFCHSVRSDWNHGNAHFLRGVGSELVRQGHEVLFCEPLDGWSLRNLLQDHGREPLETFRRRYPELSVATYDGEGTLEPLLDGADLVLVHEWTDPAVVAGIGAARGNGGNFRLLFHDTHHRTVTRPAEVEALELEGYDGVLAFGHSLKDVYLERGLAERVWVWHEAADTRRFVPRPHAAPERGDVVWIGNWGDDERTEELRRFFLRPADRLDLRADVHGVRYPRHALDELRSHGIRYRGWIPNVEVPDLFAAFRATVHVPRRPYVEALPGIPTIRVFEALACGVPLVSGLWEDVEGLFRPGEDFLVACDEEEMVAHLAAVMRDEDLAASLASRGRETVEARHTCAHRVRELLQIHGELT